MKFGRNTTTGLQGMQTRKCDANANADDNANTIADANGNRTRLNLFPSPWLGRGNIKMSMKSYTQKKVIKWTQELI